MTVSDVSLAIALMVSQRGTAAAAVAGLTRSPGCSSVVKCVPTPVTTVPFRASVMVPVNATGSGWFVTVRAEVTCSVIGWAEADCAKASPARRAKARRIGRVVIARGLP